MTPGGTYRPVAEDSCFTMPLCICEASSFVQHPLHLGVPPSNGEFSLFHRMSACSSQSSSELWVFNKEAKLLDKTTDHILVGFLNDVPMLWRA